MSPPSSLPQSERHRPTPASKGAQAGDKLAARNFPRQPPQNASNMNTTASHIIFRPAPKPPKVLGLATPVPPVRNETGHHVGGDELRDFHVEVETLARLIFVPPSVTAPITVRSAMERTYEVAEQLTLENRKWTRAFTKEELDRNVEMEARAKRQAEHDAANEKRSVALREAERVDKRTKEQAAEFKPKSATIQRNSPAWAIERGQFIAGLNDTRGKHGLQPLAF